MWHYVIGETIVKGRYVGSVFMPFKSKGAALYHAIAKSGVEWQDGEGYGWVIESWNAEGHKYVPVRFVKEEE